jgi:aminoglycoside phosphotransferase family enzyme/predicted kinase
MSDPAFYPGAASRVEVRETHISLVFLTDDLVYKIKKPVELGFLDFRTLSDRRRFCLREVELNRRLSKGVYMDVVDIREDASGRLTLGGEGETVEHAVRMARLPDEANLASLLDRKPLDDTRLAALGDVLAEFYASAQRGENIDAFGQPELIRVNTEENFEQIGPYVPGRLDSAKWDFIREVSRSFLADHEDILRHRVREGRIRDGHGDLRADHIYFHNGVQVIDCIEFNERFRYGDAALDLAFLVMDLDRLGHGRTGRRLLSAYARTARDPEVYALLDFYAAYRALVRLKVACFSLERAGDEALREAKRYLELAYRYALCFGRPVLWIFAGLPGSGKSTLAERVSRALFMPLFQSDLVRKEDPDFPDQGVAPLDAGAYQPVMRGRVYAKMLNLAQDQLRRGRSAALDATFSDGKWRSEAMDLARSHNVGLIFVHCSCSAETLRTRLAKREAGLSDARVFHLDDMMKRFAPFGTDTEAVRMDIDTDGSEEGCFYEILDRGWALRSVQTGKLADL